MKLCPNTFLKDKNMFGKSENGNFENVPSLENLKMDILKMCLENGK